MLSDEEIKRLKRWASKFFEDNDKDISVFDIDGEIDKKIS